VFEDKEGKLYYEDTGEPVPKFKTRPCPVCGLRPSDFGNHDPCMANLPGVIRACCGHGIREGHILFANGVLIKGNFRVSKVDLTAWKKKHGVT